MTSNFKTKLVVKELTDNNYELDKRHKDLFEGLAKIRKQNRKDKFQEWLSSKNEDGFIIKNICTFGLQKIKIIELVKFSIIFRRNTFKPIE